MAVSASAMSPVKEIEMHVGDNARITCAEPTVELHLGVWRESRNRILGPIETNDDAAL